MLLVREPPARYVVEVTVVMEDRGRPSEDQGYQLAADGAAETAIPLAAVLVSSTAFPQDPANWSIDSPEMAFSKHG